MRNKAAGRFELGVIVLLLTIAQWFFSAGVAVAQEDKTSAKTTACPPDAIGRTNYVDELTNKIKNEWNKTSYPKKAKQDTVVEFTINKTGAVSQLQVKKRSGNPKQDEAVLKTITQLSPMGALPEDAPDTVSVEVSLGKKRR